MPSKQDKARKELMRTHGHKYKRHFLLEGYYCFYCGDPANTLDHVPPLHEMPNLPYEKRKKNRLPASLLSCCAECNSALGSRQLITAEDRLLFLESYYDAKLKKKKALWSDDEINELGYSLKEYVRHEQDKLRRYIDKIRHIQSRYIRTETHPVWCDDSEISDEEYKV
jgi:hypothetical protein